MTRSGTIPIAVFGSGRGSNFQAILDAARGGRLTGISIALVVSNNSDAGILEAARTHGIPALHCSRKQFPGDAAFETALLEALRRHGVQAIALAGYMKKVPPAVIAAYRGRILNIHPALLPRFGGQGMYGIHVHEAVLAAGERESGATVHIVDEEYDRGAILLQHHVPVLADDTPASLAARVLEVEHQLYPEALRRFAASMIHQPSGGCVPQIRRALVSVSDKRGLLEFVAGLRAMDVEILSTGGTLAALKAAGIEARAVTEVIGFPEILDGRVKTLHPKIHGALLGRPDLPEHVRQMQEHGIEPIDLVVVNLYPFEQTIAKPGVLREEAIEQIDIGGPSMLRSAAKNHAFKAVVVNPDRYGAILEEMRTSGGTLSAATCASLAVEVFRHTSAYDAAIAEYLGAGEGLPADLRVTAPREYDLRYGENPHQRAALYGRFSELFVKLHGKELSFNNILDLSAAALLSAEFDEPTVVIVKHTNPCGVGSAPSLAEAYDRAFATDTKSPFGGIIAVNRPLDLEAAERINQIFTEVLIAPDYPAPVLDLLRKKKDRRLIRLHGDLRAALRYDLRSVPGGFLLQDPDRPQTMSAEQFRVVTRRAPTAEEERALRFAWRVAKHVKSNAIVYARADRTLGIGAGQMSRVDAARIAAVKAEEAGLHLDGCAVGSDAFFPFPDGLLETVRAGATAVIQPGGSVRDDEVIAAANEHDIAMVFTGTRHFRH